MMKYLEVRWREPRRKLFKPKRGKR